MCGICGKLTIQTQSNIDEALIKRMCATLVHRGPDDEGIYVGKGSGAGAGARAGLGHRRLSIIDLSAAGHQPMANEDRTLWIVLNGEIYNFQELRCELKLRGHRFVSGSDTEVVLHLYEEAGDACVTQLRGMFAFAIWDEKRGRLFAARDRVGKKPFYYYQKNGTFIFGSEIKAILQDPTVSAQVNRSAITDYLTYGYTPAPLSMFTDINKLEPAHTLVWEKGEVAIRRYWDLDFSPKTTLSLGACRERTLELLEEATRLRLISDVPLGAFLSGGVDSSAVVYMMSRASRGAVKTFSIGFEEATHNELPYAKIVAERFGTEHHEFIVRPDAIALLPKLVWYYNEPYADSSALPSYYVAQMTRRQVTVALNGDGGDENFGGYERFLAARVAERFARLPRWLRGSIERAVGGSLRDSLAHNNLPAKLKRFLAMASKPYRERHYNWMTIFRDSEKTALFCADFRRELTGVSSFAYLDRIFDQGTSADVVDQVMYADIMSYLPEDLLVKMDIAAMANSLEGRSPFLDHKLLEFSASLPSDYKIRGGTLKYVLKSALRGKLPDSILDRSKMGFGVPVNDWFRGSLQKYTREILLDPVALNRGYFDQDALRRLIEDHVQGRANNGARIWALLNLELWHRIFIDKSLSVTG